MVGCNGHDTLRESYLRSALRTFTNLLPSLSSFRYETWLDPDYVAFEFEEKNTISDDSDSAMTRSIITKK